MRNKRGILATGEATGHAHSVDAEVQTLDGGVREFEGASEVVHEEHHRIALPAKKLRSAQVVEFDPISQVERTVSD